MALISEKNRERLNKVATVIVGGALLGSAATYGIQMLEEGDNLSIQDDAQELRETDDQENQQSEVRTESSRLADELEINNSGEPNRQLYSC